MEDKDKSESVLSSTSLMTLVGGGLRRVSRRSQVVGVVLGLYLVFIASTSLQMVGTRRSGARGQAKIVPKSNEDSVLITEFGRRKKVIKDTCEKFGVYTTKDKLLAKLKLKPGPELTEGVEKDDELWSLLKKTSHHQFFVQKEHGLMWCKVPKAASTSWLHAYLTLAHVPKYDIPEDNGMGLHAFLRDQYPLLSKNLNKHFMPLSLKFLVVRHPFQRIMSAYLDKLENFSRDLKYRGGYYYAMYGADIVTKYREKYQAKFPKNPLFLKKEPSFVEFIEYLVETPITNYDEHWRPMFLLCPPCHFKFDVIVKMETFDRDTEFILRQRNLNDIISLHKKHSSSGGAHEKKETNSSNITRSLFSQLSRQLVRALYEKFRVDFLMFEYDIEEYINYASDSVGLMPDVMPGVTLATSDTKAQEKEETVTEAESESESPV